MNRHLIKGSILLGVFGVLALWGTRGLAADQFHGMVLEVKSERCGPEPGTCKGAVVIGYCEAGVISVKVEPGSTTIRRSGREVTLEALRYGDKVLAELASHLPPEDVPGYVRDAGVAKVIEVQ